MKSNLKIVAGLFVGVIVGAAATFGLHAQARPPAYLITSIQNITDPEGMKTVIQKASPELIAKAGGRYIIRTNEITGFEGTPPKRFVVIAFDSVEKAQAYHDGAQKEYAALRAKSAETTSFMVQGLSN